MATLFVVGDSTLSSFNDSNYYYPRFGYGTKLNEYFNINVCNLALSGRSSKSFLKDDNYRILKENIKEGDILLIGFGHNDEKYDDPMRFTDARLDYTDEKSFGYYLNEYYIKLARSVSATPILATPIVRITPDSYTGKAIHDTEYGNYQKYVLDLGLKLGVEVLDLTKETLEFALKVGYDKMIYYHAITNGVKDKNGNILPDFKAVDQTHLSMLGAKHVSYIIASLVKDSGSVLEKYLKDIELIEPTIEKDLVMNPLFKIREYKTPDLNNYNPKAHFKCNNGYYGTAFGECEISPIKENSSYNAYIDDNGYMIIGNKTPYGKINASKDVMSFLFKQVSVKKNFKMKGDIEVTYLDPSAQQAFGLMLRDDCYINQMENDVTIATPYIATGLCTANGITHINFYRKSSTVINFTNDSFLGYPKNGMKITCEIERLGQAVNIKTIIDGKEYVLNLVDFDLTSIDKDFLYCGFYAVKGVMIKVTNYEFIMLGDAIQA